MRIATIMHSLNTVTANTHSGPEILARDLCEALVRLGHEVRVYSIKGTEIPGAEVRHIYEGAIDPWNNDGFELREVDHRAWATADARGWADIIHSHGDLAAAFAPFASAPIVCTIHHTLLPQCRDLFLRHPDCHYVFVSEDHRRRWDIPNSHAILNGVNLELFKPVPEEQVDDYLFWAGRVVKDKGLAEAMLVARESGQRLLAGGPGYPNEYQYYQEMLRKFDGHQFVWLGEMSQRRIAALMARAKAFLFPVSWDEPGALMTMEAMACGCPVIATRRGCVPEQIVEGVNGRLVDTWEEMIPWAADPQVSRAACRAEAEARFGAERMAREYAALFERIVEDA